MKLFQKKSEIWTDMYIQRGFKNKKFLEMMMETLYLLEENNSDIDKPIIKEKRFFIIDKIMTLQGF